MDVDAGQLLDEGMGLLVSSRQTTTADGDTKSLALQQLEASQAQTYVVAALVKLVADRGRRPL